MFRQIVKVFKQKNTAQATPVFIISFNRKWQLERSLASYRQLGNIEIIIHDNGSDDSEVVAYLQRLESRGSTVKWGAKITDAMQLNNINETIKEYFSRHPATNYIVTDPDIELLPGADDMIQVLNDLLDEYPDVESVGPMLRIDDIPRGYSLRNNVYNRHIEQFWGKKPTIVSHNNHDIAFLKCGIDTTFAMHRAGKDFRRLTSGMRLYGRYSARHLDWYREDLAQDAYFKNSHAAIAHWGNVAFHKEFKTDKLKYSTYYDVEQSQGRLKMVKRRVV